MAEWEEGIEGKNPLLNELVIENISKYLSFEELKVCRVLNHLWKKTTTKIFLKLSTKLFLVFLHSPEKDNQQIMTLSRFMDIYSNLENPHPIAQLIRQYRNFVVYDVTDTEEDISTFYNFMTEVGPQMTSLKLNNVHVLRNSQDLADIVSSKYTPNLEELIIEDLEEIDDYQQSDFKTVRIEGKENKHLRRLEVAVNLENRWLDVLSRYPKLKALSLRRFSANVVEEIATGLVTIRKADQMKLKLTELEISNDSPDNDDNDSNSDTDDNDTNSDTDDTDSDFDNDSHADVKAQWRKILDLLKTANLPLEKICVDGNVSEKICPALIQNYGENLKSLILKDYIPQPLPLMKALEDMVVEGCDDLTFLTKVPNLKSLSFHTDNLTFFPKSTPNPLLSLTKLKCRGKEWNVTMMEQLLLWMPNVLNLKMRLNNTTMSCICQHLPNLKKLTVRGEDLDDSGVVGEFDGALVEGCSSNITNLKALETFKMTGSPVLAKGLTEKSVFYGFSLMPKLKNLTINVKSKLSADAMLALNRGIKSVKVRVGWMAQPQSDTE